MAFNLDAAIKAAETDLLCNKLFCLLIGPTGGGKSGTIATLNMKTLFLYVGNDDHGVTSAKAQAKVLGLDPKNIVQVPVSVDDNKKQLSDDAAYKRTLDILKSHEQIKAAGFKAVVIDGITEVEAMILETSEWAEEVRTKYKDNKSYAGPVTISMFRRIITAAKELQRATGVHIIFTAIMDVKTYEDDGTISEGEIKLRGYDVVTFVTPQFDDRLFISHMTDGESYPVPRFQMSISVNRKTADFNTKVLKKTFKVRPRLMGVDMSTLPESLKADLSRIVAFKEAGKYFKEETKK